MGRSLINVKVMNMKLLILFTLCNVLHMVLGQIGFAKWLTDNPTEVENVEVPWVKEKPVPEWLLGTYLKNGPALSTFGGQKRYANVADGWGKVNKFNIDSNGVRWSAKFLRTPTFKKCEEAHEIVPHITLGAVEPDDWTLADFPEISANSADNTMVTIFKMADEFIASTDLAEVNIFNITTLEQIQIFDTNPASTGSSAHWRKEPGTNNMLNYHIKGTAGVWETLHLYRYPGGDLHHPEEIGSFHITHSTMIHMFSVTEQYAIFFIYPISIDMVCGMNHLLHNLMECLRWKGETTSTDIVVISLTTGKVVSHTYTEGIYSTHHINAYETIEEDSEKVVVDIVRAPWYALVNFTDRNSILNWEDSGAMSNKFILSRYTIDITKNEVEESSWSNELGIPYINQFDFPLINPEYEGKPYCYAYGQAIVENYRQYLVKKNICNSAEDKVWFIENHYTGEPYFIPRPGADLEDDGVVLVTVMNGYTEETYLLLLDGLSFETIATATLPEHIPMSIHATWVPEIV